MADPITFKPFLGWLDVPNPNEPPAAARFITAADLIRYETFGRDAATLLSAHETRLAGLDTKVAGEATKLNTLSTNVGNTFTNLSNSLAPKANPTFTGTVSGVTKAHVGLSNVDNTSDANKPVSTTQRLAIDAVGNRVTALETSRNAVSPKVTSAISVWNTELLLTQIPSYTFRAGRNYSLRMAGSNHSDGATHAFSCKIRLGAVVSSGVIAANPNPLDGTIWTAPIAMSGAYESIEGTYTPAVDSTFRVYLTAIRAVGSGTIFIAPGTHFVIQDLGPAA